VGGGEGGRWRRGVLLPTDGAVLDAFPPAGGGKCWGPRKVQAQLATSGDGVAVDGIRCGGSKAYTLQAVKHNIILNIKYNKIEYYTTL